MSEAPVTIPVVIADEIAQAAATLEGVSEALAYRAAAEGDEMLAVLSDVIDAQVDVMRGAVR